MQPESFDRPVYEGEIKAKKPLVSESVERQIPKIIGLIVIIAIAFGLYWFFFGSNVAVTLKVVDTEEKLINNASGVLKQGNNTITVINSALTTVDLKPGTYSALVQADGFKTFSQNIAISSDSKEFPIILVKDLKSSISNFTIPDKIYAGQELEGVIELSNDSTITEREVELIVKTTSGLQLEAIPQKITVPAKTTATATLKITAPTSIKVKDKANGDLEKISVKIAGLTEKEEKSIKVFELVDVSITSSKLDFSATAGSDPSLKSLKIRNREKFNIEEPVQFKFEIISSSSNLDYNAIKSWIIPIRGINSIAAESTAQADFELRIPANALADNITGTATAKTSFWQQTIPLVIEVKEAKINLNVSLTPSNATIGRENGSFEQKRGTLTLRNSSSFDIENISISNSCTTEWVFIETSFLAKLNKSESREIQLTLSAPVSAAVNTPTYCNFKVEFDDPTSLGETLSRTTNLTITATD